MQYGPQPWEGMVAETCGAFGIAPSPGSAREQDYQLVTRVLDWQAAKRAIEVFNWPDKAAAVAEFTANPQLGRILSAMKRAQEGASLVAPSDAIAQTEGMAVAMAYRSVEDEDPDGVPDQRSIVD